MQISSISILRLCLPTYFFPYCVPTLILYAFLKATFPDHLFFHTIILLIKCLVKNTAGSYVSLLHITFFNICCFLCLRPRYSPRRFVIYTSSYSQIDFYTVYKIKTMIMAVSSTIRVITKYFCTSKETKKKYSRQLEMQNTILCESLIIFNIHIGVLFYIFYLTLNFKFCKIFSVR